jgi:hypothetical protein
MTGLWTEVHTSRRSYCVRGMAQVVWAPGEKVVSMMTAPCICGAADMGDDSWDLDVRPDCPVHNSDTSGDQPTMAEDPF